MTKDELTTVGLMASLLARDIQTALEATGKVEIERDGLKAQLQERNEFIERSQAYNDERNAGADEAVALFKRKKTEAEAERDRLRDENAEQARRIVNQASEIERLTELLKASENTEAAG